jgi:hypothetical protein
MLQSACNVFTPDSHGVSLVTDELINVLFACPLSWEVTGEGEELEAVIRYLGIMVLLRVVN